MKLIFSYMRPYLGRMSLGFVIKVAGTIVELVLPMILKQLIDVAVPSGDMRSVLLWGGGMLLCALIALTANVVANRMAEAVARDTTRRLRHDLFARSVCLSCAQVDEIGIPSLESRLTTDTYNIHQIIGQMQRMGVRAPILFLGGIGITFVMEPVLTCVLLAILPIVTVLVWRVQRKGLPLYTQLQREVDRLVRVVRENISGVRIIKALSKTEYEKTRFDEVNAQVARQEQKAGITMAMSNPSMGLLLNVGMTAVVLLGAYRLNAGHTTAGAIVTFLSFFAHILNAIQAITRIFIASSKSSASAKRIQAVLAQPDDLPLDAAVPPKADAPHIEFDNVSFRYREQGSMGRGFGVKDISFALAKGQTLGIIGETGSGKSTLIHLLMRLYDVKGGEIHIGGRPLRSIPPRELHTMFGVVFQNDTLFAQTIAENIDFARGISENEVRLAAEQAQALPFISEIEAGFDHKLTTRGTNLSGGQKQRVLLARALAGKPEILILDDSSSALDYKTDANLRRAIAKDFTGTTSIIIAQRVSSLMHADKILVLAQGGIIGMGKHEELLADCEVYREIHESQMGGGSVA